jgi:hypothetical protein
MTNRLLFFAVIAISQLFIACNTVSGPVPWQLRLAMDSVYHFVITDETIVNMNRNGPDTITTGFSLRCTQQTDSLLTFQLVVEQLERSERGFGFFLVGKSAAEMEKMRQEEAAFDDSCKQGVIGDSLEITCNTKGRILEVQGVERIVEKITNNTHKDSRDVYSQLHDQFSTKVMQDLLTRVLFYLPARTVKAGDNWVNNYTLIAKAPVKYSNLVTMQRLQDDSVVMDLKTVLSAKTGEGGRVYGEGNQWGTVTASLATGMPYRITLRDTLVTQTDTYRVKAGHVFTVIMR